MAKKVFITGASAGIGLATLRRFAAAGWQVTAGVRSTARATELSGLLHREGIDTRHAIFDLSDRAGSDAALDALIAEGVPDVLINNASIGTFGPVELTSDEQIDLALETNFTAPLRIIRAMVPHFRARGDGVIVNVSSGFGFTSEVGQGLYSATKHAVEGLSESLSLELRPFGVRVVVIECGSTQTEFNSKGMAAPGYGPDSPYWDAISARYGQLGSTIWKGGIQEPAAVAEAIFNAATDSATPLFVPVGRDVELVARLRGRDGLGTYGQRFEQALSELA